VQFSVIHTYAQPADVVFALLTEFPCIRAKYEDFGHHDVELVEEQHAADGSTLIRTSRVVPLDRPGMATKFTSPERRVTQTDRWSARDAQGRRTGAFTIEGAGTFTRVHGSLRLQPVSPAECTNTIDVTVVCTFPVLGPRISRSIATEVRRAMDHELSWTAARLAS
jgi:Protein of unknown function (DUF2505)